MELERTGYERDRAEERRRGIQLIDVKSMGRLPDDLRRWEIVKLNESMKNDGAMMKVPIGLTAEQFHRVLQMRNDGDEEEDRAGQAAGAEAPPGRVSLAAAVQVTSHVPTPRPGGPGPAELKCRTLCHWPGSAASLSAGPKR